MTVKQRNLVLKARWGHLWNRKLAHRYGRAASPNCPLCGQPDSAGHLLGGGQPHLCTDPAVVRMRIARHDEAVCIIHRDIAKTPLHGDYTIMDAGPLADLPLE